jgi:WD40 repeat protein/DNA-binding SARP family transcriptional activator
LLAFLLLSANRVVSRDRLVDELMPDQRPETADRALRVQVSRLRKALEPRDTDPRLIARPPGYLLRVEPGELDLDVFERLVAMGRRLLAEGDPAGATDAMREGLSLWRGRPLADLEFEPFARIEVERLEELRLVALEERIEVELMLGLHAALVPELEALVAEHPFRERLRGLLMLALYRCGRQVDGLETYRSTRALLREELGLEPGPALRQLERAMLAHDPTLDLPARPGDGGKGGAPRRPAPTVCPFKGLAAFEAADAELFFGREALVDEVVAMIDGTSLAAVIGASGSGKSSLLLAGVAPALAAGALPDGERWRQASMRPGEHPMASLAASLDGDLADAIEGLPCGARVVLVVDQFEELFTVCGDERERRAFVDALVEAAWDPERRLVVLIGLRADFFGHLSTFPELAGLVGGSHVLLGAMGERELARAIEGPSRHVDLVVEPELTDALIRDVGGQPGALPLLSTALVELWQARRDDVLTVESYELTGGVLGAVSRLAERAYASLDDEQQQVARRLLLRLGGRENDAVVRRRVPLAELDVEHDDSMSLVLSVLTAERLLTIGEGQVEVAHEALLTEWPRLRNWFDEDAQGRALHRHLNRAAVEWDQSGRDPAELYRGARLSAAADWTREHEHDLNRLEREFLDESTARSAAEEARQKRTNRRLRRQRALAVVLLLLAIAGAVVAFEQRSAAQRDATAADAERLGAQALVEPSLDRSLLLAREGVNLDDSLSTQSYLLAALLRSPAALAVLRPGVQALFDEALSPNGKTLALRGDDGAVTFFDTATRRSVGSSFPGSSQLGLCSALVGPLHGLAFSPEGRTLAVGGTDGNTATLDLIDTRSHLARPSSVAPVGMVAADVLFSPDGRTLVDGEAVSCATHPPAEVVVARDARTGRERRRSKAIPGGRLAGYTADGRWLLVTEGETRSLLLDAETLKVAATYPVGGAAALSPTAHSAAFGHPDGSVSILDLETRRSRTLPGRAGASIDALSYSAHGTRIVAAADDGSVSVWSVATGLRETDLGHSASAAAALFSPDSRTIYSASLDGTAIVWDATGRNRLGQGFRFTSSGDVQTWSAVSPDGRLLAISPGPNRVTLRDARTGTPVAPALRGPVGDVSDVVFSPDGRLVAAVGTRHAVVWSTTTRRIEHVLPVGGGADGLAFSPDGQTLGIGRGDGIDALYDLRSGRQVANLSNFGGVQDIDFSPDGKLLASASLNGTTTIWDIRSQHAVEFLSGQAPADYTVKFSPDGKLVAVGDSSGTVVLSSVATGLPVGAPLAGHNGGVTSLAFDRSGRRIVSLSGDGKLRLWDVASRKLIGAALPGSTTGGSGSVEFYPDGRHVLAAFQSGAAVVWNVDPDAWKRRACEVANRNLTRREWSDFLPGRPYRSVCP